MEIKLGTRVQILKVEETDPCAQGHKMFEGCYGYVEILWRW